MLKLKKQLVFEKEKSQTKKMKEYFCMMLKMVVKLKTSILGHSIDCSNSKVGALLTEASTQKK